MVGQSSHFLPPFQDPTIPSLQDIQTMIGVEPDGKYGPKTAEAWRAAVCNQYAVKYFEK
jgi:peptidoglycan hydrolase-like protein with peptidoglycan-binding domain